MFNFITGIDIGVLFEWKIAVVYLGGVFITDVMNFIFEEIKR